MNFGAEYTYHCHILSHEEMDMMRPVSIALPPLAANGLAFNNATKTLTWTDQSLSETAFVVQKLVGGVWTQVGVVPRLFSNPALAVLLPGGLANTVGDKLSVTDPNWVSGDQYRVVAENTVGDTWNYGTADAFPTKTAMSISAPLTAS